MNYSKKSSISGASAGIWANPLKWQGFVGTWTVTREASGDYDLTLTSAANSPFLIYPLDDGVKLVSIDLVYSIGTADLTTLTAAVKRRKMVNGIANAVTDVLAATAIAKTQSTNTRVANLVVGTTIVAGSLQPVEIGRHENDVNSMDYLPNTDEWIEIAIVNPGTSVFKFYGAWLYGDKVF